MGWTAALLRSVWMMSLLVAVSSLAWAPSIAHADEPFGSEDAARLARGDTLTFEQTVEKAHRRYVGGITYTVVDGSVSELTTLLEDVRAYRQLLPHTKQARLIGVNGDDFFVELRQGTSLLETTYTIRVRRGEGGRLFRFWLDPTKPHGIADAWGFFRISPLRGDGGGDGAGLVAGGTADGPRVLLTYGILVDVGPGIVRDLFEARLRTLVLTVPQLVRQYAFAHFRTGGRA